MLWNQGKERESLNIEIKKFEGDACVWPKLHKDNYNINDCLCSKLLSGL